MNPISLKIIYMKKIFTRISGPFKAMSVTTKMFCPTLRERFGGHFSDEAKLDLDSELSVAKEVLGCLQEGFHG